MHLSPLMLASFGLAGAIAGRLFFDRWFNHLSIYSFIWGMGLAFFELRLIDYKPLTAETWLLIGYAWIAFALGSITLIVARTAVGAPMATAGKASFVPNSGLEKRLLAAGIMVLSFVALAAVLQHWSILINKFGSITSVLLSGNVIYRMRVSEKLPGMVPYLDSFGLVAAYLAGIYSARAGRLKILALLPLVIIILEDVAQVGRAKILNAGLIFFSAYFLARVASVKEMKTRPVGKGRQLLALGLVLAILLGAAEFIRSFRGTYERFYGMSRELSKLERYPFLTPSIYLYVSSHPGVFNAYLKAGGEHPFPGSNTFAPIFRILAKFDIAEDVPDYQKFYPMPVSSNTGTYLRELHADFGIAGILLAPYLLGFFCTVLWFRIKRENRLVDLALLSHLYIVVAFTYLYQATRAGYWFISLAISLLASLAINHFCYVKISEKN